MANRWRHTEAISVIDVYTVSVVLMFFNFTRQGSRIFVGLKRTSDFFVLHFES